MKALAEIIAISPEMQSTNQKNETISRFIVTFQIGAELLHLTVFKKKAEYLAQDGYVKGSIGTLDYTFSSEVQYSQKDGSPFVRYTPKHTWTAKVVPQPAAVEPVKVPEQPLTVEQAFAAAEEMEKKDGDGLPF